MTPMGAITRSGKSARNMEDLDADGDGQLTREEIEASDLPEGEKASLLARIDGAGGAALDAEEATAALAALDAMNFDFPDSSSDEDDEEGDEEEAEEEAAASLALRAAMQAETEAAMAAEDSAAEEQARKFYRGGSFSEHQAKWAEESEASIAERQARVNQHYTVRLPQLMLTVDATLKAQKAAARAKAEY